MLEELVFLENLLAETDLILSTRLYTSSYEQSQGVPKEKHIKSNNSFLLNFCLLCNCVFAKWFLRYILRWSSNIRIYDIRFHLESIFHMISLCEVVVSVI